MTRSPRYGFDEEGKKYVIVDEITWKKTTSTSQQTPLLPLYKRIWNAIWGYGTLVGFFLTLLVIFVPSAIPALIALVMKLRGAQKHLRQIVDGVDKGLAALPEEEKGVFKAQLAMTYDTDTKKKVAEIKGG